MDVSAVSDQQSPNKKEYLPMTLTKDHIVNSIHEQLDLPKTKSTGLFESVLEIIKTTLQNGEDVLISGFGKFYVLDKKKRRGRNPHTGEDMRLDERRVIVFKCSGKLREKMNGVVS
jgi:integration host factor subunit alpha